MTRVLLIFSAVLMAGLADASQASPQYEGIFESKGTSISGASYDRHFKVIVQFLARTDIVGTAQVDEVRTCEPSLDCQKPESYVTYCKTHVNFELGKVQIQARDTRTGETVIQTLPWTSNVVDSLKKVDDQPCAMSNLEGKAVFGSVSQTFELKSAVHGKGASLYLETEPVFDGVLPAEFAMASTLQKISGDNYAVLPFSPHAQALVNWLYVHEEGAGLAWGSSGNVTLKLKN